MFDYLEKNFYIEKHKRGMYHLIQIDEEGDDIVTREYYFILARSPLKALSETKKESSFILKHHKSHYDADLYLVSRGVLLNKPLHKKGEAAAYSFFKGLGSLFSPRA